MYFECCKVSLLLCIVFPFSSTLRCCSYGILLSKSSFSCIRGAKFSELLIVNFLIGILLILSFASLNKFVDLLRDKYVKSEYLEYRLCKNCKWQIYCKHYIVTVDFVSLSCTSTFTATVIMICCYLKTVVFAFIAYSVQK